MNVKRYWCRFYALTSEMPSFEYHGPWWVSGHTADDPEQVTICAAVCADSGDQAHALLDACFDPGHSMVGLDFCNQRADDWEPFSERFPRADWMRWPFPEAS